MTCNEVCIATEWRSLSECAEWCKYCVTEKSCWTETGYGSESDVECNTKCYETITDFIGGDNYFTSCNIHGKCIYPCLEKCEDGPLKQCNIDCRTHESDDFCSYWCDNHITEDSCFGELAYGSGEDKYCYKWFYEPLQ
jgi:hypothetical protein